MTELDQALVKANEDEAARPAYYELLLNSMLFIPTHDTPGDSTELNEGDEFSPLIGEADGKDYLFVFDTQERLAAWAEEEVGFVTLPGHVITDMCPQEMHWILNIGSDYPREFISEELGWMKQMVEQAREEIGDVETGDSDSSDAATDTEESDLD